MGFEYLVRLEPWEGAASLSGLEPRFEDMPYYAGRSGGSNGQVYRFRSTARTDASAMPDVEVTVTDREIVVCQYGDAEIAALVLGAIVTEAMFAADAERVEVLRP